ncbi:SsgA family sporulation/cell division regulator [Streptomyces sp. AK02-04a]|uniref:SsgA family sporulation/cell division regulator n=1 Tax=Streptomyces sp. AK02-04a TaxID=3028649 RepID=UPI0029AD013D|nr:SsgA family sporulation/cell division regulator [Streptomyces sp. AK02-04a]MDX3763601.1 SsgA family sporulation/cell division regulator [Streptomyces sp. AK02-04a]
MAITLEQPARARLISLDEREFLGAMLRYTSLDPLAVHMDFPPEVSLDGVEITWTFYRDLLWEGLTTPAGDGDVRIWPCGRANTMLGFYGLDGMALVQFDTDDLRRFLLRTYAAVMPGQEEVGPAIDRCLSALVGEV